MSIRGTRVAAPSAGRAPGARWVVAGVLIATLMITGASIRHVLQAQTTAPYQVIVNNANPVTTLTRSDVSRLFLKKTVAWKAGGEVVPVDLSEDSEVRQAFSKDVLRKNVTAVKGYWQQLVFTGRGVPPVEKATEAEVIAYVAANRNAVGYVSRSTSLGTGVKSIRVNE